MVRCPEAGCEKCDVQYKRLPLIEHLRAVHGFEFEGVVDMTFATLDEFRDWMNSFRSINVEYIVAKNKKLKRFRKCIYHCNRSGKYRAVLNSTRRRNFDSSNSIKMGSACTSCVEAKEYETHVDVRFWPTHHGHTFELKRMHIPDEDREWICSKLSWGASPTHIVKTIRDNAEPQTKRLDLITVQDVYNAKQAFQAQIESFQCDDDLADVNTLVVNLQELGDESPIIYYKPRGKECTELHSNDICIIIMNKMQRELFISLSNKAICMDGSHGFKANYFELTTLLVIDEVGEGYPVAFMYTNRQDADVYKLMLTKIKEVNGVTTTDVFMSDITDKYYNAWREVMGEPRRRVFCLWHVDRAWRENTVKIMFAEKRDMVLRRLKLLQTIREMKNFVCLLQIINLQLERDNRTSKFAEYFRKVYGETPTMWAKCLQEDLPDGDKMDLERIRETVKCVRLEGKVVQRLITSINSLFEYMQNKEDERFARTVKKEEWHERVQILVNNPDDLCVKNSQIVDDVTLNDASDRSTLCALLEEGIEKQKTLLTQLNSGTYVNKNTVCKLTELANVWLNGIDTVLKKDKMHKYQFALKKEDIEHNYVKMEEM